MIELKSKFLHFSCEPNEGNFSLRSSNPDRPSIHRARLEATFCTSQGRHRSLAERWDVETAEETKIKTKEHGRLKCLQLVMHPDPENLVYRLTFALPDQYDFFLWKIEIENHSDRPVWVEKLDLLRAGVSVNTARGLEGSLAMNSRSADDLAFYSNGWQSWSYSASYRKGDKQPRSNLGPFQVPMVINASTQQPRWASSFASDFYAVLGDRVKKTGMVLGFLSQKQQFGTIEASIYNKAGVRMVASGDNARLDVGAQMETDWAFCSFVDLDTNDGLDVYLSAAARENHVRIPKDVPTGWCSWYHFYTKVTAEDVRANLMSMVDHQKQLPLSLVQIDDGFETQVGDWFTFKPTFPEGVTCLADEIAAAGMTPGLWLAPFIVHPNAKIIHEHPDWVLRQKNGRPVNAGFCWNAICTALDLTNPAALEYCVNVVSTAAKQWHYPYLKLDFLYAAALPGVYQDPTKTRAQVIRMGMQAIRDAIGPDVFLLACGAPLGSVLGLVEANRIGADVSGSWMPAFLGIKSLFKKEPAMPCASLSIHNIITRAHLHRQWWLNDPDCMLVRPDTELTLAEVQSLATAISITGGSLLLSDDLPNLSADRFRMAVQMVPVIDQRPQVLDWLDQETPARIKLEMKNASGDWSLLAMFNWRDHPCDLSLNLSGFQIKPGTYYVSSFWDGKTSLVSSEQLIVFTNIPAHGVVLAAIRPASTGQPVYVGGDVHISQGMEVSAWMPSEDHLACSLSLPREAEGEIRIMLPKPPIKVVLNADAIPWRALADDVYAFPVSFYQEGKLEIDY